MDSATDLEIVGTTPASIRLRFGAAGERSFTWRWLRDHGEDAASLDPTTGQRLVDTFALATDLHSRNVRRDGPDLVIEWHDDTPTTTISLRTLVRVSGVDVPIDERHAWTRASEPAPPPRASLPDLEASDHALLAALDALHRRGFVLVSGMRDDPACTHSLVDRFGGVRNSVFGEIWTVEAGSEQHEDSSYSSVALDPHTDGTYYDDGPGFEVFHFTEVAEDGGESVLVDGMSVLEQLQADVPEAGPSPAVAILASQAVPARYVEPGVDLRAQRPALRLDDDGRLVQITFNNYDRAPLWLPPAEMDAFYAAYSALRDRIVDPGNHLRLRLGRGEALLFDNWRILHGRTAFTGSRTFHGGYLRRDEVLSRHRTLSSQMAPVVGRGSGLAPGTAIG